ncbi:hypothetical protein [Scleromatobacter humisilvae]|uniref:Uncharacterized protein n=1 Tax=Scleromatobacter humisilvae TaxID=2897159 RepID=A0A9X1YKC5_9BURK|nr:hypothetical protein [Scleromatobacter humisilvae]MCK9687297.1 hypothetical protein [Scleromatobacter humisilvae]
MHQDSPLGRLFGSASKLPLVGKLFGAGSAMKGVVGFVLALAALPFVGFGPLIFWGLFKTAERASYVAAAGSFEAEKQRLPFGLIITVVIGLVLGIHSLLPESAAAPAPVHAMHAASHDLSWMNANVAAVPVGKSGFLGTGDVSGMPHFLVYAQIIAGKLFGSSLSAGAMLVAIAFVLAIGGYLLYLLTKPYMSGDPATFARDAQGLYQLSRANRLGSISRRALAVVDDVLAAYVVKCQPADHERLNSRGALMTRLVDVMFKDDPDELLKGNIEASAKRDYPPEKYPMLFKRMPVDLVRSLVIYGHTITHEPLSVRARLYVTREHVTKAYESSISTAMPSEGAVSVAGYFLAAAAFFGVANLLAGLLGIGWFMTVMCLPIAGASAFATWKWHQVNSVQRIASAALRPCNIAPVINRIINSQAAQMELEYTRDAVGPYQYDYDLIEDARAQWSKQLEIASYDGFKLMNFGTSRGTGQYRGSIYAYIQGQVIVASSHDVCRGGVFWDGPTGSGKTFTHLVPYMAQFMNAEAMFFKGLDELEDEFVASPTSTATSQTSNDEFVAA